MKKLKIIKNISFFAFAGLIIFALSSCKDSLGLESSLKKIPLFDTTKKDTTHRDTTIKDTTKKDTTKKDTVYPNIKIKTNDITLLIREIILTNDKRMDTVERVPWLVKINTGNALIDTSGLNSRIWLSLDFDNRSFMDTLDDEIFAHVLAVQTKLDSVIATGSYDLNFDFNSPTWSAMFLETLPFKKIIAFSGRNSALSLQFIEDIRTRTSGQIKALMTASYITQHSMDKIRRQILNFEATLIIKYKLP